MKRRRQVAGCPLLRPGLRLVAAVLVVACVLVIAGLGAWVAHQTHAGTLDRRADAWIAARVGAHGWIVMVSGWVAPQWVTVGCAVLAVACTAARRYRSALLVAVAVPLAGATTEYALKPLFDRTLSGNLSYPSGHVTGVSSVALAVVVLLTGPARPPWPAALRWLLSVLALLAVADMALAVVAGHYHYFTDTIGGACVGTAAVLLTALVLDWASPRLPGRRRSGPETPARGGISATAPGLPRA